MTKAEIKAAKTALKRKERISSRAGAFVLAVVMTLTSLGLGSLTGYGVETVLAAEGHAPIQGGENYEFANGMKLTSVTIDIGKLSDRNHIPDPVILNDNFEVVYLQVVGYGPTNDPAVAYKNLTEDDRGREIENTGECFYYLYKDAAILSDGTRADVKLLFSDVNIYVSEYAAGESSPPGSGWPEGDVVVASGNIIMSSTIDRGGGSWYAGVESSVTISVQKDGIPVEGEILYSMWGINVLRDNRNYTRIPSHHSDYSFPPEDNYYQWSEQVEINPADLSDNMYYPEKFTHSTSHALSSYQSGVSTTQGGNYIFHSIRGGTDNGSYLTGFATTAHAGSGMKFIFRAGTGYNSGSNRITNTIFPDDSFILAIDSSTTPGGDIQTTRSGNADGKLIPLADGDDDEIYGPGYYSVPRSKNVTYTMTPKPGYRLDKVYVDGQSITPSYVSEGSYYTYTFEDVEENHFIHVAWKPITASVELSKIWNDFENGFDTRDSVVPLTFHLKAESESSDGVISTFPNGYFLPSQHITSADNRQTVEWGIDKQDFTAADGTLVKGYDKDDTSKYPTSDPQYTNGALPYEDPAGEDADLDGKPWRDQYFYDYDHVKRQLTQYEYDKDRNSPTYNTYQPTDAVYQDLNYLPKYDAEGNRIEYSVEEDPIEYYSTRYRLTKAGDEADPDKAVFKYEVDNELEAIGTVQIEADKGLDGRSFRADDKFTLILSGEDGSPMPVDSAAVPGSGNPGTPAAVEKDITGAAGSANGKANFGVITITSKDMIPKEIKYSDGFSEDVSQAEHDSVRYWTAVDSSTGMEITYDLTDQDPLSRSGEAAFDQLDDSDKNNAKGEVLSNTFIYYIAEKSTDKVSEGESLDTPAVTNDTTTKRVEVYALFDQLKNKMLVSAKKENGEWITGKDATVVNAAGLSEPMVILNPVNFLNTYNSEASWIPEAVKVLDGRPLERDQFNFKLHAIDEGVAANADSTGWLTYTPVLHARSDEGELLFYDDAGVPKTLSEGGNEARPVQVTNENAGTIAAENKDKAKEKALLDTSDTTVWDYDQDVIKDEAAADKGTNDLYGPVTFDRITYTNADLAKRIEAGGDPDLRVIYWRDGNTLYGPVPDDATNSSAIVIDGKTYDEGTLTYGTATDAEREAANSYTENSVWTWTDSEGIVDPALKGRTYTKVIGTVPDSSGARKYYKEETDPATGNTEMSLTGVPSGLGVYYETEREFKYTIWEVKSSDDWGLTAYGGGAYENKPEETETEAKVVSVTIADDLDGTINVVPAEPPVFSNEYRAKGVVELWATKKIDDRSEFGRGTFTGKHEFTFTVEAVTDTTVDGTTVKAAPLPENTEITIKPQSGNEYDFSFGNIEFTHEVLMDSSGKNYIASRSKDGCYERTFVYKITETAISGGGMENENSPSADARNTIFVSITVREDKFGNIEVVAVNGADSDEILNDKFSNENIGFENLEEGSQSYPPEDKAEFKEKWKVNAGTVYNTYQAAGSLDLSAEKTLEGKTLEDNMFYFELSLVAPKGDGTGTEGSGTEPGRVVIDEKPNKADGSVVFDTIVYNLNQVRADADAGLCEGPGGQTKDDMALNGPWIYTYEVKELVPSDGAKAEGIFYDTTVHKITVTVNDNGDGTLAAAADPEDPVEFVNRAESVDIIVSKTWNDDELYSLSGKGYDRPNSVSVQLVADDVPAGEAVALSEETNNWSHTWEELPKYKYEYGTDGAVIKTLINYTIEETPAAKGYSVTYKLNGAATGDEGTAVPSIDSEDDYDGGSATVEIINTPVVVDKVVADIVIHKIDSVTGKNIEGAVFTLTLPDDAAIDYTTDDKGLVHVELGELYELLIISEDTEFYIKEKTAPDGYKKVETIYTFSPKEVINVELDPANKNRFIKTWNLSSEDGDYNENTRVLTVKNVPEAKEITVTGSKVWEGGEESEHVNAGINLLLYRQSAKPGSSAQTVTVDKTDTDKFEWSAKTGNAAYTFKALDKYDAEGYEYTYWVTEEPIDGYRTTYTNAPDQQNADDRVYTGGTITNTNTRTDSLKVTKVWDDEENAQGLRPESVTFHLYISDGKSAGVEARTLAGAQTSVEWTDLPVYAAGGGKITYKVVEEAVSGYTTSYTGAQTIQLDGDASAEVQEIIVTNKIAAAVTEVPVTKKWDDGSNIEGRRPESITISLYKRTWNEAAAKYGNEAAAKDSEGEDIKLVITGDDAADTWTGKFSGLQATENGKTVIYSVKEEAADNAALAREGYTSSVIEGDQVGGFKITNTRTANTVSIGGAKVWTDGGQIHDNTTELKDKLIVKRQAYKTETGPDDVETIVPDGDIETVPSEDMHIDWEGANYTVTGLKQYNRNGNLYTYWAEEAAVDGYTASYDNSGADVPEEQKTAADKAYDGGIINNTLNKARLIINKVWDDAEDIDGKRPESLTVTVMTGGERARDTSGNEVPDIIVTAAEGWKKTVDNLPAYKDGSKIGYTLQEAAIDDYSHDASSDVTVTEGFNRADSVLEYSFEIANHYDHPSIDVSVRKIWDDNDDQSGIRPDHVIVRLKASVDGEIGEEDKAILEKLNNSLKPMVLDEEGGWADTYEGLLEFIGGKAVVYSASEDDVKGYTEKVEGDQTSGFIITNTHTTEIVTVKAVKVWDDQDNDLGTRPDRVAVTLKASAPVFGEEEAKTDTLSLVIEGETWMIERAGLPAYYEGSRVEYTWTETVPSGYIAAYSTEVTPPEAATETDPAKDEVQTTTITNTLKHAEISIGKRWDDLAGVSHTEDELKELLILFADDTALEDSKYYSEDHLVVTKGEGTSENTYFTVTFKDLPAVDSLGETITYSVGEKAVQGYAVSFKGNVSGDRALNGGMIINTRLVNIRVDKFWDDNDDSDGMRPLSVKAALTQNGVLTGEERILDESSGWAGSWTGKPYADLNGSRIYYGISEEDPEGYTHQVVPANGTDASGFNAAGALYAFMLRNSREELPYSFCIGKNWDDAQNILGLRPSVLRFVITLADGTPVSASDFNRGAQITDNAGHVLTFDGTDADPLADGTLSFAGGTITAAADSLPLSVQGLKSFTLSDQQQTKTVADGDTVLIYTVSAKTPVSYVVAEDAPGFGYELTNVSGSIETGHVIFTNSLDVRKLEIEKTVLDAPSDGAEFGLYEVIRYNVTVRNTGTSTVTGVNITDTMHTGAVPLAEGLTLTPGSMASFTYEHVVTSEDIKASEGQLSNTASVTGDGISTVEDTETVKIEEPLSGVDVTKTADGPANGQYYKLGEIVRYSIVVRNTGNQPLTDVKLTDPLTGLDKTIGYIAPYSQACPETTLHVITEEDILAGELSNTAKVRTDDPLNPGSEITDGDTVVIKPLETAKPSLVVVKTPVRDSDFKAGETIYYGIVVINTGNITIKNVEVTDQIKGKEAEVLEKIDVLAPNESRTFIYSYKVTEEDAITGVISNTARVSGDYESDTPHDPVIVEDTADVKTAPPVPALNVKKTVTSTTPVGRSYYLEGETIKYSVKVTNTGTATLKNVEVKDSINSRVASVIGTINVLAPGESKEFNYSYKVTAADTKTGSVKNNALAEAADPNDPSGPKVSASDTVLSTAIAQKPVNPVNPVNPDGGGGGRSQGGSPRTGDESNMMIYVIAAAFALVLAAGALLMQRRRKKR